MLYPLAAKENLSQCNASNTSSLPASTCIFNDVTVGNNEVPGEKGYPNAPYNAGVGYDQATGLGSVNATNLANGWAAATFNATTTSLSITPTTITHGQPVNVDVTVTANGGKGMPTGEVSLVSYATYPQIGVPLQNFILSNGTLLTSTNDLPGGYYAVTARYAGNSTCAPSNSSQVIVTVNPEGSQTKLSVCTYPTQQNSCPAFTSGPYGSLVYLRADVSSSTQKCPPDCGVATGNVNFLDNSSPVIGSPYSLNSQGNTATPDGIFTFAPGSHSVVASYNGDGSYDPSQSSPPYAFTMTQAATTNTVTYAGAPQGATLTATITTNSGGNPPSGTVTFSVNGTPVGGAQPVDFVYPIINPITDQVTTGAQATATYTDTQIASGQTYNVTASYSGDANYKPSNSPVTKVSVQPDFVFAENQNYITVSAPGGSGNLTLTITANDGYNGTVSFSSSSCSGLPAGATCSFSPTSVTGGGASTLSVTTTASTTGRLKRDIRRKEPLWAMSSGGLIMGLSASPG